MKLNENDRKALVRRLDETAEKNPLLWLPCVVLLAVILGFSRLAEDIREAFAYSGNAAVTESHSTAVLRKKPLGMRVLAMSLVMAFSLMLVPDLGKAIGASVFAEETEAYSEEGEYSVSETEPDTEAVTETGAETETETKSETETGTETEIETKSETETGTETEIETKSETETGTETETETKSETETGAETETGTKIETEAKAVMGAETAENYPVSQAEDASILASGSVNGYYTWTLTDDEKLTITNNGLSGYNINESDLLDEITEKLPYFTFLYVTDIVIDGSGNVDEIMLSNDSIENLTISGSIEVKNFNIHCAKLTNLDLSGLKNKKIYGDPGAFSDCAWIEKVILPDGIEIIGSKSFSGCTFLSDINLPGSLKSIEDKAFENCSPYLTSITLNEGLEDIGAYAFSNSGLTSIEIPGSVKKISIGAFSDTPIEEVTFNEGLLTIEDSAFVETSLTKVKLPDSLLTIGANVFYTSSIQSITFGKNIQTISDDFLGESYEGRLSNTYNNLVYLYGYHRTAFEDYEEFFEEKYPVEYELMEFTYLDEEEEDPLLGVLDKAGNGSVVDVLMSDYNDHFITQAFIDAKEKNVKIRLVGDNFKYTIDCSDFNEESITSRYQIIHIGVNEDSGYLTNRESDRVIAVNVYEKGYSEPFEGEFEFELSSEEDDLSGKKVSAFAQYGSEAFALYASEAFSSVSGFSVTDGNKLVGPMRIYGSDYEYIFVIADDDVECIYDNDAVLHDLTFPKNVEISYEYNGKTVRVSDDAGTIRIPEGTKVTLTSQDKNYRVFKADKATLVPIDTESDLISYEFTMGKNDVVISVDNNDGDGDGDDDGDDDDDGDFDSDPYKSNNAGQSDYTNVKRWYFPVNSYLVEKSDSRLERVEYISGTGVVVEGYRKDGRIVYQEVIEPELPIFGGFYSGDNYNFLVFGQDNPGSSNTVEVMRVVKYSKDWERLDSCSITGANTKDIFQAGSLRMDETANKLIIHTSHGMYSGHQANMTFVINKYDMTVNNSCYEVMYIGNGYVSHSFNQFVKTSGDYVYRVDHGDAYPRAVVITKAPLDDVTDVGNSYVYALEIQGETGNNDTGVSVGGFELSYNGLLVAGNSVDQSDPKTYNTNGQRNIFISYAPYDFSYSYVNWLTDYTSGVIVGNPHLVKINGDKFVVLWEETRSNNTVVKYVVVDGTGNVIRSADTVDARLSDCKPVAVSENQIMWYYTANSFPVFVTIDVSENQPPHTHSSSKGWVSNAQYHWKVCDNCGNNFDRAVHTEDGGVVTRKPTATTKGVRTYTCTVCGKTRTEDIPATGTDITGSYVNSGNRDSDSSSKTPPLSEEGSAGAGIISRSSAETISVRVENRITGKNQTIRAIRDGDKVTANVRGENNGYYANVYTADGECIVSVLIEHSKAKFTVDDNVKFTIVIDEYAHRDDIQATAGAYGSSVPIETAAVPVSNGVTVPSVKLPQNMKLSDKKRRYRILRRRKLDDMIFVY